MSYLDIWNIRGALEPAIQQAMGDTLTALTTQDAQQFQKARARVEIMFIWGGSKDKHLAPADRTKLADDVEDAWSGTVRLQIITEADKDIHASYEAFCRYVMHTLPSRINEKVLTYHKVYGPIQHLGTGLTMKSNEGVYMTEINFGLVVSIHASAWAQLNTN